MTAFRLATCAALLLLASCQRERPAVTRLLANEPFESITLNDTTMPARRIDVVASPQTTALGSAHAGELLLYASVQDGSDVRATLAADPSASACSISSAPQWQPCRFRVADSTDDLRLQLQTNDGRPARIVLSQPLLRSGPPSPALVIVILVDTVRFDRLISYDAAMPVGTAIDRLARDGLVFEQVHSSSSWTRPAIATLFTGLDASTHKVLGRDDMISADLPRLSTVMQRSGYRTVAWSTNPNILPRWGFHVGFDEFHDLGGKAWPAEKVDATAVFAAMRTILDEREPRPAFLYAHLMDAHAPYRPDDADLAAVTADPRAMATFPGIETTAPTLADYARYLAEIRGMDSELGRFLDDLRARGLYEPAAILVLADHGEEFFDHGGNRHGRTLYEEVLRIPVILKLPGDALAGTRVGTPMSLADVAPTLLGLLGLEGLGTVDGRNVWNATTRSFETTPAPQHALLRIDTYQQAAIIDVGRKLILDYQGERGGFFDLAQDPRERRNLLPASAAEATALRVLLDAKIAQHDAGWHVRLCGGSRASHAGMHVNVAGRLTTASLESTDRVETGPSAEHDVALDLVPSASERVISNRVWKGMRPDEDDLIAADPAADRLAIRMTDGTSIRWARGTADPSPASATFTATSSEPDVSVRPSEPIECRPPSWVDSDAAPVEPYVRVWYVAPEDRHTTEVDPALVERLRALGYQR